MGYTTVRKAVVDWLRAENIEGVARVYKDAPWWIAGETFQFDTTGEFAAALFVHIDRSTESRVTVPALTGSKDVTYTITIGILYQYIIPARLEQGQWEDQWVVGIDYLIDTLKARLRSNPNLGASPTIVFQAAQQDDGIQIDQDLPQVDVGGGFVKCFARLTFSLDEIITA